MKPEIYLIGTNHYDLNGPARLEKLLDHLQPGYVSVEIDKHRAQEAKQMDEKLYSPVERRKLEETILSQFPNADRKTVRETNQLGYYEYLTARAYCWQNGSPIAGLPLILADSAKSVAKIKQKCGDNAPLLSMPPSELTQVVEQMYQENPVNISTCDVERLNFVARDAYTETKLRRLLRMIKIKNWFKEKKEQPKIVHVGGLAHSFGNYHNLFDRLADLNPVRIKLNEADKL